jgi:hypothetical protein
VNRQPDKMYTQCMSCVIYFINTTPEYILQDYHIKLHHSLFQRQHSSYRMQLITHLHVLQKLGMGGAIYLPSHAIVTRTGIALFHRIHIYSHVNRLCVEMSAEYSSDITYVFHPNANE